MSLVSFGVHAVQVTQSTLGGYGLRFVQVPTSQRGLNQLFGVRLYVRLGSGTEEFPLFLIKVTAEIAFPGKH